MKAFESVFDHNNDKGPQRVKIQHPVINISEPSILHRAESSNSVSPSSVPNAFKLGEQDRRKYRRLSLSAKQESFFQKSNIQSPLSLKSRFTNIFKEDILKSEMDRATPSNETVDQKLNLRTDESSTKLKAIPSANRKRKNLIDVVSDETDVVPLSNELHTIQHPSTCSHDMNPDVYVQRLFMSILGFQPKPRKSLEIKSSTDGPSFFPPLSEDELANYGVDVVTATREKDLKTLKSLHSTGRSLSCCNRFGESLLHMACRRGFVSIASFFVEEAGVSIRITDDGGRTPLHDALWNRDCQFEIVDMIIRRDPALLFSCDSRGFTPFAYARREHWGVWRQFLWDRRDHLKAAVDIDEMKLFQ